MQQRLSREPAGSLMEDFSHISLSVWVSFAEVYNEYVYDLLQPEPPRGHLRNKLPLGQNEKGRTYIKNLSNICVSSGLEAYEILQYGMHNLNYATTAVNQHSSRSHCIFTIKLVQALSRKEIQISHFNFCDLAGSERIKNTCSMGERLKESNNINSSLHVLGRCIQAIRESQKNKDSRLIPYRESKLTRLFQPALSGQESIAMIVNMNPEEYMFDESQHVLNFSAIAKDVVVETAPKPIRLPVKNRFSHYMESKTLPLCSIEEDDQSEISILREKIESLYKEIEYERALNNINELRVRKELTTEFNAYIEEMTEGWQKRLAATKKNIKALYVRRLEEKENYYQNLICKASNDSNVSDIIDLTDTDAVEKESDVQIAQLKFDLKIKDKELNCLLAEQKKMETMYMAAKNNEVKLQKIIDDAVTQCVELEEENTRIEHELEVTNNLLYDAQEEIDDLKKQLSTQAIQQIENVEYVEQLEELNRTLAEINVQDDNVRMLPDIETGNSD